MPYLNLHCRPRLIYPCTIWEQTRLDNDWVFQSLTGEGALEANGSSQLVDRLELLLAEGASLPVDLDCAGRDGMYEK